MVGGSTEVYSDFENYVGGIYHHVTGEYQGDHAIKIVGWGLENGVGYWKVANSWNPYWGENGFFRMAGETCCAVRSRGNEFQSLRLARRP